MVNRNWLPSDGECLRYAFVRQLDLPHQPVLIRKGLERAAEFCRLSLPATNCNEDTMHVPTKPIREYPWFIRLLKFPRNFPLANYRPLKPPCAEAF